MNQTPSFQDVLEMFQHQPSVSSKDMSPEMLLKVNLLNKYTRKNRIGDNFCTTPSCRHRQRYHAVCNQRHHRHNVYTLRTLRVVDHVTPAPQPQVSNSFTDEELDMIVQTILEKAYDNTPPQVSTSFTEEELDSIVQSILEEAYKVVEEPTSDQIDKIIDEFMASLVQ